MTDIACPEAEVALLGCLLRMPYPSVLDVVQRLRPDDLTDPRNRAVLAVVVQVAVTGADPDPVLVLGQLRREGLERSFTADRDAGTYLLDVYTAAGVVVNVDGYLRIVLEHAYRRRVVEAAQRLEQHAGTLALVELEELIEAETGAVREASARLRGRAEPRMQVAA